MKHNELFLAVRNRLVQDLDVDVNATYKDGSNEDSLKTQVVIEPATENNTNITFSTTFDTTPEYFITLVIVGENTKSADELFDEVRSIVALNEFSGFDVVSVESAYTGVVEKDNVYHRKGMTIGLR